VKVIVDNLGMIVGPWVCSQLGMQYCPTEMTTVGLWDTEKELVLAGLVYEKYNGVCVTMHQAISDPRVITKDFLWYVFYYPFAQLGCDRLTGIVSGDNTAAIKLNEKLGFEVEARLVRACPAGDLLIMRMFRENCRFLIRGKRDGRRKGGFPRCTELCGSSN